MSQHRIPISCLIRSLEASSHNSYVEQPAVQTAAEAWSSLQAPHALAKPSARAEGEHKRPPNHHNVLNIVMTFYYHNDINFATSSKNRA
jgi:hypothetical protein